MTCQTNSLLHEVSSYFINFYHEKFLKLLVVVLKVLTAEGQALSPIPLNLTQPLEKSFFLVHDSVFHILCVDRTQWIFDYPYCYPACKIAE